ncbi:hypothetical protein KFU94_66125 [Chloroflexi bacterium TSY]|nr:hypothetical protein [Chloroflexi bacterium TSY]
MKTTNNGSHPAPTNQEIAQQLEAVAELLDAQQANPFRVRAYRMAAETVRGLAEPAAKLLEKDGVDGLQRLPNIGESIARAIEQLLHRGKLNLLERLRGEIAPVRVLSTVPGIGPKLAELIHEKLDIETLIDLQTAAYDGRLDEVPGFGPKRLRGIRESLAGRLRRVSPASARIRPAPADQPSVDELLDVDREYREKVRAKTLPRIAPRRFNPTHEAWLPVLHTDRGPTHYTALYSNTARAHELGTIHDWVVIYRDGKNQNGQWTVVTARYGPMQGRRIVRGREAECQKYYTILAQN